jgi:ribose transport system substrate-binding protein
VADETGIYRFIKAVTPAEKILLQDLTQNPTVMGVFSDNDEMVPGVVLALRQIGKLIPVGQQGHVSIVSVNGTPDAVDRIRQGAQDASVGNEQ